MSENLPSKSKKNSTAVFLLAGFVALLISAIFVFKTSQQSHEDEGWKNHSQVVLSDIRRLLVILIDAETSERGFIISQNDEFLAPFQSSQVRLGPAYDDLKREVSDNAQQTETLQNASEIIQRELTFLSGVIQQVQNGRQEVARERVRSGEGKRNMDQIRKLLAEMEDLEIQILAERTAKSAKTNEVFNGVMYLSLGMVFLLMTLAVRNLLQALQERNEVGRQLLDLKEKAISASKMKSEFLANMSHEIRTPLNGIRGMVQLLVETPLSSEQEEYVGILEDSSMALVSLINDILDFSKIEAGRLELELLPVDIREVINSVAGVMNYPAKHNGLVLQLDLDSNLPQLVLADPLRLRQVLLNLISNAVKFSKDGEVKIRAVLLSVHESRARVRFEVIDQGIGFDEATKERLFKVFSQADSSTTRRFGGTGLGLAICKQLVDLRGGTIGADSVPGKGATFWFEIPYDIASARIREAMPVSADVTFTPENAPQILIVEDHLVNQKVITNLLGKMGCQFQIAENGIQALKALESEKFDLVLMDCHMPEMDGYEATRQIRHGGKVLQPNVPIVATTANIQKGEREKCLAVGMSDFVTKPVSFQELRTKIVKWTQKKESSNIVLMDAAAAEKLKRYSSDEDQLLQEIVAIFVKTFPQDLAYMHEMLRRSDFTELSERAHRMKSTCTHLGLKPMQELCLDIEKEASEKNRLQMARNLEKLEKFFKMALEEFKKLPKAG